VRVLLIGGSGFIGPFVAEHLVADGHEVTGFHRGLGRMPMPSRIRHLYGDRQRLPDQRPVFEKLAPDVVVDFILSSRRQAAALMETFRGITGRVVAISSQDVYRACGILHGFEEGPLQPLPIEEDSELRTHPSVYSPQVLDKLRQSFPWLDDEYDKIPVERAVLGHPALPGTVLRLPMLYGPGDPLHRLFPILKRIDDKRPAILIQEDAAGWRGPRGYVENVAAGIALATVSPEAAGRIYNLGEAEPFSELGWTQRVARAAGWRGRIVSLPKDRMPLHLRVSYRMDQHWVVSTRRIRDELGFSERVALQQALARTIEWERANPPAPVDPAEFNYAAEDAALAAAEPGEITEFAPDSVR